ncbi:MAG: hypothetical protein BMS9Abin34_031 [Patescibacteria group bacterium]|nr:MAG: hypothetical protein BMS9Abin34_031 [Patescibacteria group bacterium]
MSKALVTIGSKKAGKPALIQRETAIAIGGNEIRSGKLIDLVFIIDTTGSMTDKIDGLLKTCSEFIDDFARLGLDCQIAIVSFGDLTVPGDRIDAFPFTKRAEAAKRYLSDIPMNNGGGNDGESSLEALEKAMTLESRSGSVRVFILITDEPAHGGRSRIKTVTARLTKREIMVFVISPSLDYFKRMAKQTGGDWYQIAADTSFRSILDLFRTVSKKVSQVVLDVHQLGQGSVSRYLQLKSGK